MIISPAYAQAPTGGADGGTMNIIFIVLMFAMLYFLMIRPQMKRAKEHKQMVEALQKGDEVIVAGGVVGKISKLSEQYATIEIAPSTEIIVQRGAVQVALPKGTIKTLQ